MIRALILLLVTAITILFGGTPDWARGIAMAGIGALALLSGMLSLRTTAPSMTQSDRWALLVFALILGWGVFTTMPGSAGFVAPSASDKIAELLSIKPSGTISVAPDLTGQTLLWLTALGVFFYCVHLTARRHPDFSRIAVWSIAAIAVAFAFYGLVLRALGLEIVLWHEKQAYLGAMTGPFINKNHFATMLGIGLVCTVSLFFEVRDRAPQPQRMREYGVGSRLTGIRFERLAVLILAFGVLITALILTQSRAGVGATLFGLFVVLVCGMLSGRKRALPIMIAAGLGGLACVIVFFIQDDGLRQRLEMTEGALEGRLALYESVADISLQNPVTGTGLGTFEQVYRMHKPEAVHHYFDVAHNTYLELAFEMGWPAALAMIGIFALFLLSAVSALSRKAQRPTPLLALLGSSAVVGSHALFDFSLQIPAITLIYLLLVAAALGAHRAADA